MELQFYGANCVRITAKKASIVIDDNLSDLGAKSITKEDDILLQTHNMAQALPASRIALDQPGEYEVADVSIHGVAARGHMDLETERTVTMYRVVIDDIKVGIIGHVYPEISSEQLEALGMIDILIIPVGGNGYTLDSIGALKLIRAIEPKIVVPTHYDSKKLKFEVPQQPLEEALKGLSMEPKETVQKLKVKSGEIADILQLIILEEQ